MSFLDDKEYRTIQIHKSIKEQIVDHCNTKGLKIGRFVEELFKNHVSSSMGQA